MTQITSRIQPFSRLILTVIFLTLACFVFSQFAFAQRATTEAHITIVLKDFSVHPNTTRAKAGKLVLKAVNEGRGLHELVILKTDLNPAALPRKEAKPLQGMGTQYLVDEDDPRIQTIDEIEEFPPGTSQSKTVILVPGHYVLFCNIPGHYDKGMFASLQVLPSKKPHLIEKPEASVSSLTLRKCC